MFGPQWGGVHARDTLPTVARTGRRGMIVNTDASTGQGVHWIAVLDEDGTRAMSDPLGAVGVAQRSALDAIEQPVWSEDDTEQDRRESTCGPKSLAAIAVGLAHGRAIQIGPGQSGPLKTGHGTKGPFYYRASRPGPVIK